MSHGFKIGLKILVVLLLCLSSSGWMWPFPNERAKGDSGFASGKFDKAIEHYKRALDKDGNDWELLYNLGTAYYKNGEWDKAIEELSYATDLSELAEVPDESRAKIFHNLGLSYLQNDDCENATQALGKATELDPENEDIARNNNFSKDYCSEETKDAASDEGEEKDQGAGNDKDDKQGQNDKGQNNDEANANDQSNADKGQDKSSGSSDGNKQDDANKNQGNDQQNKTDKQGDKGDDADKLGGQGNNDQQQEDNQADQGKQGNEKGENENKSGGDNPGKNESAGGSDNNAPRAIPNDNLGWSDGEVQRLLDYMSKRERVNGPRYFHNRQGGGFADDETLYQMLQRLFWGSPSDQSNQQPDDGIDW
ncbi:MAG: tetratricopeptide repeat protein [bacterium]